MKKLGLSVVGATALCAALAFSFAGCSNSAGVPVNPVTPVNNESKILDMRIKKNGQVVDGIAMSVTENFGDGIWTSDCLSSTYCAVENVTGGLKFTIKRPNDDCYNPEKCKEVKQVDANGNPVYSYEYVGAGNGSYNAVLENVGQGNGGFKKVYDFVGDGKGAYKLENGAYTYVGFPNGNYNERIVNVGQGNGDYGTVYKNVGQGNGNYEYTDTKKVYGGWGYTAIYREEKIKGEIVQTTCAVVSTGGDKVECVYPLCEPGERYVFKVQIEPSDVNTYRDFQRYEWLSITAEDGIGDIDYSNINIGKHCNLTYDGTKPTVKLVDCIAPNAKEVKPLVSFFVTDSEDGSAIDWETPNATKWFYEYRGKSENDDEIPAENVSTGFGHGSFKDMLEKTGKKRFFAQYFYSFEVSKGSGISSWKTAGVDSQIVSFMQ